MESYHQILQLLATTDGFISGQTIADQLNCSRTAVWKGINTLRDNGYVIESGGKRGYHLADNGKLAVPLIQRAMHSTTPLSIEVAATLPSTNAKAKELSTKHPTTPIAIIADTQTAGYGRQGRTFFSPAGTGIYVTLLLPHLTNSLNPGLLTTSTAVVLSQTISRLLGVEPTIKWVNDVNVNGQKVAGILTEGIADFETRGLGAIIIGTGINYLTPAAAFPPEVAGRGVGTLEEAAKKAGVSRNVFIGAYLDGLLGMLNSYTTGKYMDEYRKRCDLIGKAITIQQGTTKITGTVQTINNVGQLVLTTGQVFSAGEVTKVRPQ
ncbi:biotin--[acetyl-CoA-carboxylase] ligase [Ligilactobacillus sp. LYQ60]|uniref:biotin--[acetyl-CoA-carboxylase] ligase n=1 Tax=unclassified Ligilactobacillus TaxID=2767920 RepID=UPI0038533492